MLENLRTAFVLARTESSGSASAALADWKSIQGELRLAMRRMPKFIVDPNDRSTLHYAEAIAALQATLTGIGATLFTGGVYAEAHAAALKETNLQAPDLVRQVERFKEVAKELTEVEKFAYTGFQLTGEDAISAILAEKEFEQTGHDIFELVKGPSEIAEKLEKYKEQGRLGKAVTIVEITDKAASMAHAGATLTCDIVKRFAEEQEKRLLGQGLETAAEQWGVVAKSFKKHLDVLKSIGTVVTIITVVVSVVRVIDLLAQGKLAEAASEAASTIGGLAAGLATGAGGAAMVGGIEVVIGAEIEAIHGAAAMIRWCNDQNVHEAAWSFVGVCQAAASLGARDFVADVKLLAETTGPAERASIEEKLASYAKYWLRDVDALSNQIADTRASQMGGQPDLRAALGADTLRILETPESWAGSWPSMAEQISVVFAGSNAMTKYVYEHYSQKEEKKPDEVESSD